MTRKTTRKLSARRLGTGLVLGLSAVMLMGVSASDADARPRHKHKRVVVVKPAKTRTVHVRYAHRPHRVDRVVVRTTACARPWWKSARRIAYRDSGYYYNTRLGVCFGGAALNLALADAAPYGYLYLDPVSGLTFRSVSEYKCYVGMYPRRPQVLTVVKIDV